MMNDMIIPENINSMLKTMCPISLKIQYEKSDYKGRNGRFDMKEGKVVDQISVTNDRYTKPRISLIELVSPELRLEIVSMEGENFSPIFH